MTSESTSSDPIEAAEESVAEATAADSPSAAEQAAEATGKPLEAGPPAQADDEPVILLDPGYQLPGMAKLPAGQPLEPIASGSILHGNRPLIEGVRVEISQDALEQVRLHSESDMRTELGGFLLGIPHEKDGQTVVDIRAALPAHSDDHGPIHFTFTADSWSMMHQERESMYPHLQVVGWFHTHPDLGVFYSGDDVVVHSVGFAMPWHVGLVVDPIRLRVGWFGWFGDGQRKELDKLAGFYEMTNVQSRGITPWSIAERSAVWATYSESELAYGDDSSSGAAEGVNGSALGGLGAFLGIIGVLMALFIWVLGYVPLRREFNELQTATIAIVESELISANAQGIANCSGTELLFLAPTAGDWVPAGDTIPVIVNAATPGANGYRLVETTSTGLLNRSRDIGYFERFTVTGELTNYEVPDLPYGTPVELELVPVTAQSNSDFCSITLFVGNQ